jgi:hypothetical protein
MYNWLNSDLHQIWNALNGIYETEYKFLNSDLREIWLAISGGGGPGINTIAWQDLKDLTTGDGARPGFYNVTDRPNTGTDPMTVQLLIIGGTTVSTTATIERTNDFGTFQHTIFYDFISDVIIFEVDSKNNIVYLTNGDVINFPFDSPNITNNIINTRDEVVFTNYLGVFRNNKILDNSTINLTDSYFEFSNCQFLGPSSIDVSEYTTEFSGGFYDTIVKDSNLGNIYTRGLQNAISATFENVRYRGKISPFQSIISFYVGKEYSDLPTIFSSNPDVDFADFTFFGSLQFDDTSLNSVSNLEYAPKVGKMFDCEIDWTTSSITVSRTVQVAWQAFNPLSTTVQVGGLSYLTWSITNDIFVIDGIVF